MLAKEVSINVRRVLIVFTITSVSLVGTFAHAESKQNPPQKQHVGQVRDWTQGHIIFSDKQTPRSVIAARKEIRAQMWASERAARRAKREEKKNAKKDAKKNKKASHVDWSVSLGAGNTAPNMFPAKYGFDINGTPSCTND